MVPSSASHSKFLSLSSRASYAIRDLVPANKRHLDDKTWYVHNSYVPSVVAYLYLKFGEIDYSGLSEKLRKDIDTLKGKHQSLTSIVGKKDCEYNALYLTKEAPTFIIDAVWKAIVKHLHPDVGGDSATFVKLKTAYETIKCTRSHQENGTKSNT